MPAVTDFKAYVHYATPQGKRTAVHVGDYPEEITSMALSELVGNGLAKIRIAKDVGIKDFGNGVSVRIEVELTVNQDNDTVHRAVSEAFPVIAHYADSLLSSEEAKFKTMMESRQGVRNGRAGF